MTWQRKIPFGYRIVNGEIAVNPDEAQAVKGIFSSFLGGASFATIADTMTASGPRYHAEKPDWNKHMVKRMLENTKYIGTDDYPAIIISDTFKKAQRLRISKTEHYTPHPDCNNAVKRKLICGCCDSAFKRSASQKDGVRWWHCSNEECGGTLKTTDAELESRVVLLLNQLIENPALLDMATAPPAISTEAERLKNEINRELGKTDFDEGRTKALIFAQAAAKYAALGDWDDLFRKSEALKNQIVAMPPLTAFDSEFFHAAVAAVMVSAGGTLSLRLISGACIAEKGDSDHADDNHD
jgi:hypothetical protein